MKILLLISESWNDTLHPNNNMTNWFDGMGGIEIATVYASPSLPHNNCCSRYFQLTESMMVKSLLGRGPAGRSFEIKSTVKSIKLVQEESARPYKLFKNLSNEFIRLIRDIIWKTGRINSMALDHFIKDFEPDIIFTQRKGSVKMCRIERMIKRMTQAPMVAYTGDDEYSLKQLSYSPIYWLRRLWVRHELKKNIPLYQIFYSMSEEQMAEFRRKFKSNTKFLVKCGVFDEMKIHRGCHHPIEITYAGKLYCNRWKTLKLLVECIAEFNRDSQRFRLNVYTRDKVNKHQNRILNDGYNSIIKGAVSANDLASVYAASDILLHVESFDRKNSLATKYSFSTKIMECLSSGCAIMAIGKANQAGCTYLKEQDAALVASSREEIMDILSSISADNMIIDQFARKAYDCGIKNHQRSLVQKQLLSDFKRVIDN